MNWDRRRFLSRSAFGLGSIALMHQSLAENGASIQAKADRCIFLNMIGGSSQVDLFDPKPKLNELDGKPLPDSLLKRYRFPGGARLAKETVSIKGSPRRFKQHGQSGMVFSDLMPEIAKHADRLTMLRSMQTDDVIHAPAQLKFATGFPTDGFPSIGSWLTYGLGSLSESLPNYVVMWSGMNNYRSTSLWSGNPLPGNHGGVLIQSAEQPLSNLHSAQPIHPTLEESSVDLLRELHQHRRDHLLSGSISESEREQARSIDRQIKDRELAFRLQTTAPEAFDLVDESARTRQEYGLDRPGTDNTFAEHCLLSRRMIERGVRFVHLLHSHWDTHDDIDIELPNLCRTVDQPIGALLGDLDRRGLLDRTLVVWATEFGRTCFAEIRHASPGRDHHVDAFSLWLAGAGLKPGTVIGATDDLGWEPIERPIHVRDLHATILHLFGLDQFQLEIEMSGRPVRLTDTGGRVVSEMLA